MPDSHKKVTNTSIVLLQNAEESHLQLQFDDFFLVFFLFFFSERAARGGGGGGAARLFFFFFFPCSADHERDWPPCKVVFFGLATNALNVRNNNNNNHEQADAGRNG